MIFEWLSDASVQIFIGYFVGTVFGILSASFFLIKKIPSAFTEYLATHNYIRYYKDENNKIHIKKLNED